MVGAVVKVVFNGLVTCNVYGIGETIKYDLNVKKGMEHSKSITNTSI